MEASFFSNPLSQSECRIKIASQLLSESECRNLGHDLTQKTQTNKMALLVYYRWQWSSGKVIFSQASVILFTGGSASLHAGIPPPARQTPLARRYPPSKADPPLARRPLPPARRYPLARQTPLARRPLPQQGDTPWQGDPPGKADPLARRPPGIVHAGRYGKQTGGMHPTGMQFLFWCVSCEI